MTSKEKQTMDALFEGLLEDIREAEQEYIFTEAAWNWILRLKKRVQNAKLDVFQT